MDDLDNKTARTFAPNGAGSSPDYVITIKLNNNSSIAGIGYRPPLLIARTFAHEIIHAEMFRKLMYLTQEPNFSGFTRQNLLDKLENSDYVGIYDYFRRFKKGWQHQQMAAHYREAITDILKEFDNGRHSDQFYNDLAWGGLQGTVVWNALSSEEQARITSAIVSYRDINKYKTCQ